MGAGGGGGRGGEGRRGEGRYKGGVVHVIEGDRRISVLCTSHPSLAPAR